MLAILPKIVKEKDSRLLYILCIMEKRSVCKFRLTFQHFCLFVSGLDCSFASQIEAVFAEFPGLVMRHKAIEVVCAHGFSTLLI